MSEASIETARYAGRFVGALLDCHAGLCPWTQTNRRDLRGAWLAGFSEGRIARIRLAETECPHFEVSIATFKNGC